MKWKKIELDTTRLLDDDMNACFVCTKITHKAA